ncbi:MAG: hypothetical protein ACAF41_07280 [Leptolyngbya sp. BL-A-14]
MKPNFDAMSRDELRAYVLKHRDDDDAFAVYVNRMTSEPVLAHGTPDDASDPIRFAKIFEQVQKIKQ